MIRLTLLATVCSFSLMGAATAARISFEAALDGKSEVPAKTTEGAGQALVTLDTVTKMISYTITFQGLSGPAAAAHFHGPAASGANAGVAVPIGGKEPQSPVSGTATLTDDQIKQLEAGMWYVNIHTAANPGGEIRGQVVRPGMGGHGMGGMAMPHGNMAHGAAMPHGNTPQGNTPMKH